MKVAIFALPGLCVVRAIVCRSSGHDNKWFRLSLHDYNIRRQALENPHIFRKKARRHYVSGEQCNSAT